MVCWGTTKSGARFGGDSQEEGAQEPYLISHQVAAPGISDVLIDQGEKSDQCGFVEMERVLVIASVIFPSEELS